MPKKKSLTILSDIDGVIAHSQINILQVLNKRHEASFAYGDISSFDFFHSKAIELGYTDPADAGAWLFAAEVMALAEPIPQSQAIVSQLVELGVVLQLVTSRPWDQKEITVQWVNQWFPEITQVHLRSADNSIEGRQYKAQMLETIRAEVYLEDDPRVIELICKMRSSDQLPNLKAVVLLDRPWNKDCDLPPGFYRAGNWRDNDYGWDQIFQLVQEQIG
ncbi:MAG: hypothetical protein GF381_04330 [Candidatus Pacebacteria bacterium]|nr:hypothetical protein [Candidatus Paceibacterota bacterium]